jgi:hypothetical protein
MGTAALSLTLRCNVSERFLNQALKVFAAKQNHHLQKSAHKTAFS